MVTTKVVFDKYHEYNYAVDTAMPRERLVEEATKAYKAALEAHLDEVERRYENLRRLL